jgi:putative flippase GtrA
MRGQVLRFLLLGGANTLITAAAFYGLAAVLPARAAFTIVYAAGLAFVVLATPRYVFGSRSSWSRRVLLALWYLATYGVGIGVISLLSSVASAPRGAVVIGTVFVTAPLSFLGARLLVGADAYRSGDRAPADGSTPSG